MKDGTEYEGLDDEAVLPLISGDSWVFVQPMSLKEVVTESTDDQSGFS
jgi:hypothetical protein